MTKDAPSSPQTAPPAPAPEAPAPRRKSRAETPAAPAPAAPTPAPAAPTPTPAAPTESLSAELLSGLGELNLDGLNLERLGQAAPVAAAFNAAPPAPAAAQPAPVQAAPVQPAPAQSTAQVAPTEPVRAADQVVIPPEVLSSAPAAPVAAPVQANVLRPRFPSSGPFLSRFLPDVPSSQTGLQRGFCDLHDYLHYLHEQLWYGYLYAELGEQAAYVLVYEGRAVAAACLSSTGEEALGELLHLYEQGARLSAYPLDSHIAHILSGVGSRAWKFSLTPDFTGLHAQPDRATFYDMGRVVAVMPSGLPYEGAFPAPLRPPTLTLPRSLAGWAHHSYVPTLRGRDAVNAITPAHQAFKAKFGAAGLQLQSALLEGLSPAEYALKSDMPLHELEVMVQELVALGYIKGE